MRRLLIADDNPAITDILKTYAEKEGYAVFVAEDGAQAIQLFHQIQPDVVLLDVTMPKIDGFSVCRQLRAQSAVPIIMITARQADYDRIMGLDIGADDYIVKPFSPGEVMARIRAIFRRLPMEEEKTRLVIGPLAIDMDVFRADINGEPLGLTKKEIELLWVFLSQQNKALTRDVLLDAVWGWDYEGDYRTVDTHVKRLRKKLESHNDVPGRIETVWGVGYQWRDEGHES